LTVYHPRALRRLLLDRQPRDGVPDPSSWNRQLVTQRRQECKEEQNLANDDAGIRQVTRGTAISH
jgi:hypothetical protein